MAKSQLRALDYVQEFDELEHYHANLRVVDAMKRPDLYAGAKYVASFDELNRVSTFPRPVTAALNEVLGLDRSRDFYMNLYRIHRLVEAQRPVGGVEVFEQTVFSIINKILFK